MNTRTNGTRGLFWAETLKNTQFSVDRSNWIVMLLVITALPQFDAVPGYSPPGRRGVHELDRGTIEQAVDDAAGGDRAAFAVLWDTYQPRVRRFVRARVVGRSGTDDVDDIVAEAFIDAWRGLPRYTWTGAPFASWLFTIADRRVLMHHRTHTRRVTIVTNQLPDVADGGESEEALDEVVLAALAQLPDIQRRVLELRFFGELKTAEIAACLNKREDAIRQLQARALTKLRDLLSPLTAGSSS